MRQSAKGEGTKIAQAAKDLNVTSVTIRRYISEFNIETTADENGIKVLPSRSMDELQEVRRLKEDGLTNPQVLEGLEVMRARAEKPAARGKKEVEPKKTARRVSESAKAEPVKEKPEPIKAEKAEPVKKEAVKKEVKKPERRVMRKEEVAPVAVDDEDVAEAVDTGDQEDADGQPKDEAGLGDLAADGRSKHSLTCQTCGNVFEHMNPRLRDCLDCYRAKRKERRRGGDKHKNIIQHPLAQQVASKQQQREGREVGEVSEEPRVAREPREPREPREVREPRGDRDSRRDGRTPSRERYLDEPGTTIDASPFAGAPPAKRLSQERVSPLATGLIRQPVRNSRKAIEETRGITANLKRRLERPDLPENERRWLEQIYAYQLILHQGWRHLAEYKAGTGTQKPEA